MEAPSETLILKLQLPTRVARFLLVHDTKIGKNVPNDQKVFQMIIKYLKCPYDFPNGIEYINVFQSKAFQNLPKLGVLV
jgi:hypothetical protein